MLNGARAPARARERDGYNLNERDLGVDTCTSATSELFRLSGQNAPTLRSCWRNLRISISLGFRFEKDVYTQANHNNFLMG